jgi:hypothetical protein
MSVQFIDVKEGYSQKQTKGPQENNADIPI